MSSLSADHDTGPYRSCPLCEACCGLEVRSRGRQVMQIRAADGDGALQPATWDETLLQEARLAELHVAVAAGDALIAAAVGAQKSQTG
jgi:hypothetical protein